ncbi:MAG: DUF2637 domain-containing protein [Streptosporangiaceae bacterium]
MKLLSKLHPLRRARAKLRHPDAPPVPSGMLRGPRRAALGAITVVLAAASGTSFAESYRGLWLWASHHGLAGLWADIWPLQIDVFIAVGELALFVALLDRWSTRSRTAAWTVTLVGLAVSVAGNIGHVVTHSLTSRATAAVPPLAAAAALAVGLGVLKRVVEAHHRDVPETASDQAGFHPLDAQLVALSSLVPLDAQSAAAMAMRATLAVGSPLSGRQLETRFGLSRADAAKVRAAALAEANGQAPQATEEDTSD